MDLSFITPDLFPILVAVMAVFCLILLVWVIRLELRFRRLMRGGNGKSLEQAILSIMNAHRGTIEYQKNADSLFSQLHNRLTRAARGLATVRFNALAGDTSGRQSFATAILSERGDGVVISSMHSRENTRVYAKPVVGFASEHDLTEEERAAIAEARKQCENC